MKEDGEGEIDNCEYCEGRLDDSVSDGTSKTRCGVLGGGGEDLGVAIWRDW